MITDWNPILFLVQGSKPNIVGYLVNDMIESKPPDKSLNGWTQSTVEGPVFYRKEGPVVAKIDLIPCRHPLGNCAYITTVFSCVTNRYAV
jgi:hypothetical protein